MSRVGNEWACRRWRSRLRGGQASKRDFKALLGEVSWVGLRSREEEVGVGGPAGLPPQRLMTHLSPAGGHHAPTQTRTELKHASMQVQTYLQVEGVQGPV